MRKKLFLGGALTLAVFGITAGSALALTPVQTIDGVLGNKATPKFDKKKFKKTSVEVTTTTSDADNPAGMPPKANKAEIKFDKKDMKFDTKAAKGCDPNAIENTSTEAALSACGSAKVGSGSAVAALPFGAGGTRQDFPATVTAFNRSDAKGILLHSRVDSLGTTVVLKGSLSGTNLSIDISAAGWRRRRDRRVQLEDQEGQLRPGPVQVEEDQVPGHVHVHRRPVGDGNRHAEVQAQVAPRA